MGNCAMPVNKLVPMVGNSTDGRFNVIQNGIKGFLPNTANRKMRRYMRDMRVLNNDENMRQYEKPQRRGHYPGRYGPPTWHRFVNSAPKQGGEDPDEDGSALQTGGGHRNDGADRAAMKNLLYASNIRRGRVRGPVSNDGKERAGPVRYTHGRGDHINDDSMGPDDVIEEPEDGLTTFRINAWNRDNPIDFELGEVIEVQPLAGFGPRRLLQVENIILGREALVNDITRMAHRHVRQGQEGSEEARGTGRSKALYTAYIRAKVMINEATMDMTATPSLNNEQGS